jgi:two-component system chemotaxis response regulator CheY
MRVLVVDDSAFMRSKIRGILEVSGHEVIGMAENGERAIDMALELQPDLLTLDNMLPDMTGLDVLKTLRSQNHDCKVIMISAVGQRSVVQEGLSLGALDYIIKPFERKDLINALKRL